MESIISTALNVMGILLLPVVSYVIWMRQEQYKLKQQNRKSIKQLRKKKAELKDVKIRNMVLDEVISISSASHITNAVNKIFNKTSADRFLLLFAINGKHHFNVISVFFEQHKTGDMEVNAVTRYRDVKIDDAYRDMLKDMESNGGILLETETMKPCLLKDFYTLEGIYHAFVTHILRHEIDKENDVVIYSSFSNHIDKKFTKRELTLAKLQYTSAIIPNISKLLKEKLN
jgi:hypothetical protein